MIPVFSIRFNLYFLNEMLGATSAHKISGKTPLHVSFCSSYIYLENLVDKS